MGTATGASPPVLCSICTQQGTACSAPQSLHGVVGKVQRTTHTTGTPGGTREKTRIGASISACQPLMALKLHGQGDHLFLLLIIFHLLARHRRQLPVPHLPPPSGRINRSHVHRGAQSAAP